MKRNNAVIIASLLVFSLTFGIGCSSNDNGDEEKPKTETSEEVDSDENKGPKELKLGETWEVPGKWKLTINSVTTTDMRNENLNLDVEEVVVVDYSYENLGFKADSSGLYFAPYNIVDETGQVGEAYYSLNIPPFPKEIPVGTRLDSAKSALGIYNPSNEVKIGFEIYDDDFNAYRVFFNCPVEK
ncbi:MAG: hypothetical protein Q4P31_07000 [Andreesenia angusta]|nr:hypothetical protein [Andreesenia angusta]